MADPQKKHGANIFRVTVAYLAVLRATGALLECYGQPCRAITVEERGFNHRTTILSSSYHAMQAQ